MLSKSLFLLFFYIILDLRTNATIFSTFCTQCLTDLHNCACSETASGRLSIDCHGPSNITTFPKILKSEIENCTKYEEIGVRFAINIWGYNYSTIPANAINLSVINSSSFSVEFLSNPSLVNVDTNAFVSIKGGITSLWLYNGGIQEIPFEVLLNTDFACVDGVGPDISFQFNKISRVPENQFERLMEKIGCSFGNIYLGQNNIQNLTDGSFSNLIIANSLDLTGNQITQISSGAFQNISIGYQLQLGYNNITDIDPEAFEMATIDTLTLSYNQLIEIPYEAVTKINLTGDRMLQLDHNLIVNIHPEKFNVMLDGIGRSSISIDLSSNQITVLKQGVFRDLDNSWIGLMENKIIEMESESFYNVDFNSIFFLVLAENVTFANDTFRAPVSFESYDISIGQQKIDQPSSACILSNDSIPNICGNLQLSISNIFYMENYCPDILQNLACFNRITLSINLPGGDPKKQNFTYLGTIPSTITPLNSIELHTNPSSSGICFDGSKINAHKFVLDWGLFCTETIRSLKDIAFEITLSTFEDFPSIPSVFLEFSNLQLLVLEPPAKLNCTCAVALQFYDFAHRVSVQMTCLQDDTNFSNWLLGNYEKCAEEREMIEENVDVFESDICKSECPSFFETTTTIPNQTTTTIPNQISTTNPGSSIENLRINRNIFIFNMVFYIVKILLKT